MLTIKDYYKLFLASDIAAFPGGQSVLWQQAISWLLKHHSDEYYMLTVTQFSDKTYTINTPNFYFILKDVEALVNKLLEL